MLIEAVAQHYLATLAGRARPRTVKESTAILERIIRDLGVSTVDEITRLRVKNWRQARIAAGASNKTANNQLGVLLAALACAVEDELIERHPLAGMTALPVGPRHQRRRPRALAEWEIARLFAALDELDRERPEDGRGERIPQAIVVRVLIETGARWGELTLATWADLDLAGGTLTFRPETTKTEQLRSIPVMPETLRELETYRLACARILGAMPAGRDRIFLSPTGKPWTAGAPNFRKRILAPAYERAGLLERDASGRLRSRDGHALNVHTLRHTCCTRLLSASVPVPVVQAVMGHASPQMTLRVYAHLRAESARTYMAAMPRPGATGPDFPASACMPRPGVAY